MDWYDLTPISRILAIWQMKQKLCWTLLCLEKAVEPARVMKSYSKEVTEDIQFCDYAKL